MRLHVLAALFTAFTALGNEPSTLLQTQPLQMQGDLSAQMIEGIDRFLTKQSEQAPAARPKLWQRDFSSREAYEKSVAPNRQRLQKMIGMADPRVPVTALEYVSTTSSPAKIGDGKKYEIFAVRWPVFTDVWAEGLWFKPKSAPTARVIAIPDADQTPEILARIAPVGNSDFARKLAENGCEVLIPTLVNRDDTYSGNPKLNRFTNQPHREWIYRQSYELGRHVIGYEVQKVLAGVDWFSQQTNAPAKIGVAGYGEGGLIAFYAAAIDPRIYCTLVSGYFNSREKLWSEPIYRNVFGLLAEFGDAEIATLVLPRTLIVEHCPFPQVKGPPQPRDGRHGAAPGQIATPSLEEVTREIARAKALVGADKPNYHEPLTLINGTHAGSDEALALFLIRVSNQQNVSFAPISNFAEPTNTIVQNARQERQVRQLGEHSQRVLRGSERVREQFFWHKANAASVESWPEAQKQYQKELWATLGKIDQPLLAPNPRSRKLFTTEQFTAHEVVLDVFPEVYAWGILLLPNDVKPGERRPVVVCQHGLEGTPMDLVTLDANTQAYAYYKGFATQLADRGFITFVPQNPYRGGDKFRLLQRKANPLGWSLFSFITAQHDQILNWLSTQPFVDPTRMGFYGLSYGGKTAMRVPPLLDRYALSICSGDFNEWIYKNVTLDFVGSYMYTAEFEMPEWNLGDTFGYAEMAALIAPRPFMVERGHSDGVAIDEWVGYEYAKVKRFYDRLEIGDRTEIEWFNGPHTINGKGTFKFLHQHLQWPER